MKLLSHPYRTAQPPEEPAVPYEPTDEWAHRVAREDRAMTSLRPYPGLFSYYLKRLRQRHAAIGRRDDEFTASPVHFTIG